MIEVIIIIALFVNVFLVRNILPYWIRKVRQIGLVWRDMNKPYKTEVAGSGGVIVLIAFVMSSLIFVAYFTFYAGEASNLVQILSLLLVVVFVGGIGLIDDLFGWKKGGLSKRSRLILIAFSAVPLMAINAGRDTMLIPFIGETSLGIIYPLVFIPVGIIGATTTVNFLAGLNGLEAGQGILLLSGAAIVSYFTGNLWLSLILLCMIVALLGFLKYNFYPAKVFPGNVLTYPIGAILAAAAILGNFEKIAIFFFIPNILEVILKFRGRLEKSSFGKPLKDGSLGMKYEKVYGLTHLSILIFNKMGIEASEKKVVYSIWLFQIAIILLGLIIFREGIF